jgi:hypothetical protein
MATLESAIYNWAITKTTLTAYVGLDIYPFAAPDLIETDYIRYQLITISNEPWSFTSHHSAQPMVQFDIFSKDASRALACGNVLADLLNRFQGSLDTGLTVHFSKASGPMVLRDPSDEQWYHAIVEWEVEYERS